MTQPVWDDSIPRLRMYKRAGHLGCLAAARAIGSGHIPASAARRISKDMAVRTEFGPMMEVAGRRFINQMDLEFGRSAVTSMGHELLLSLFELGWVAAATALAGAIKKTVDPTTRPRKRK